MRTNTKRTAKVVYGSCTVCHDLKTYDTAPPETCSVCGASTAHMLVLAEKPTDEAMRAILEAHRTWLKVCIVERIMEADTVGSAGALLQDILKSVSPKGSTIRFLRTLHGKERKGS